MARPPPIPPEQRSARDERPNIATDNPRQGKGNSRMQGDEANIRQNLQPQRQVQDR